VFWRGCRPAATQPVVPLCCSPLAYPPLHVVERPEPPSHDLHKARVLQHHVRPPGGREQFSRASRRRAPEFTSRTCNAIVQPRLAVQSRIGTALHRQRLVIIRRDTGAQPPADAKAGVLEGTMLDIMGHMSTAMLRQYSHLWAHARREAIDALESWQSGADDSAKAIASVGEKKSVTH